MSYVTDTRQRLIDSARTLYHARSHAEVGVQAICQHAGVQKGSFYHFFPSKQALTLAVIDDLEERFRRRVFQDAFSVQLPPLERPRRWVEAVYELQLEERTHSGAVLGCPFGNLAAELSTLDEPVRARVLKTFTAIEAQFAATLEEAVARGDIAPLDPKATASAMLSFMEGVLLMAKARNDPELVRRLGPAVVGIRVEL
jgi:TetR/AcrR family transcriptional repressor of nem operon